MGLSPKKAHAGCGLVAGSFRVRKSYPNFWTYYCKLLAHGYTHDNTPEGGEKDQERCQKRKDEEAEARHAQRMLESINKKKQIAREVEAEYGIKSKKKKTALLKIKEEQDQGQEYFEST